MLKNKIIVRKIRNIVILLMAMIIMVGAYKNIDRSRAEDVVEIDVIAIDNYGFLGEEQFVLEAKETEDGLYQIELPESINSKKINQIIQVTVDGEIVEINTVTDNDTAEDITSAEEEPTTETEEEELIPATEEETTTTEEKIIAEEGVGTSIITLTEKQIKNKAIVKIEVAYDMAILEKKEDGTYHKNILAEKSEEERQQIEVTEETETLYNQILRYEDIENNKLVELRGYLPKDAQIQVEQVSEEALKEIFGEKKITVAYDIKILLKVVTQVPIDEADPTKQPEEIIETIEINPEDFGETCEVSITDVNISEKSQVYHVKDDNTYEQINVKENTEGNVDFEAETFSIYAISDEIIPDEGENLGAQQAWVYYRFSESEDWSEPATSVTVDLPESGTVYIRATTGEGSLYMYRSSGGTESSAYVSSGYSLSTTTTGTWIFTPYIRR